MRIEITLVLCAVLLSLTPLSLTGAEAKPKPGRWEDLFDGKSVDKWRGFKMTSFPADSWKVENGALKTVRGGHGPDIVTKEKYDNFALELEWKVTPGANSANVSNPEPAAFDGRSSIFRVSTVDEICD